MKILLLTQYYAPEVGAPQERLGYLVKFLANRGHQMTVVTCSPNYPHGNLYEGYKNNFFKSSHDIVDDSISIHRTWVYLTKGKKDFAHRLLNYLSFAISSLKVIGSVGKIDLVFVETPPIFLSFTATIYSWIKWAPKVVHFADPWVTFATENGYLKKNSLLTKLAFFLEKKSLCMSKLVVVPNPGILDSCITTHNLKPLSTKLIMNGVDTEFFYPDDMMKSSISKKYNFMDKFIVIYSGTHQIQANLDVLVKAAKKLKSTGENEICFVLVGAGADKQRIRDLALSEGVLDENFKMLDPVPVTQIREFLQASDVGANPLAASPATHKTLSVKMLSYMGIGLPLIITDRKVQSKIVQQAKCGLCCPAEDEDAWVKNILYLKNNKEKAKIMGDNGRVYASEHLSRKKLAYSMECELMKVAKLNPPPPLENVMQVTCKSNG